MSSATPQDKLSTAYSAREIEFGARGASTRCGPPPTAGSLLNPRISNFEGDAVFRIKRHGARLNTAKDGSHVALWDTAPAASASANVLPALRFLRGSLLLLTGARWRTSPQARVGPRPGSPSNRFKYAPRSSLPLSCRCFLQALRTGKTWNFSVQRMLCRATTGGRHEQEISSAADGCFASGRSVVCAKSAGDRSAQQ